MPASGHQDHAISPSASVLFVQQRFRVHRIPSRVDDVGQRPSVGKDARTSAPDLPDGTSAIFLRERLDRANHIDPPQQIGVLQQSYRAAPHPKPWGRQAFTQDMDSLARKHRRMDASWTNAR